MMGAMVAAAEAETPERASLGGRHQPQVWTSARLRGPTTFAAVCGYQLWQPPQ